MTTAADEPELPGPVLVVGAGLLGASVGLALRAHGTEVLLDDVSPEHVRTASGLGAGRPVAPTDEPRVVVVAVPPDHVGEAVVAALAHERAVVTDVGSVKTAPLEVVRAQVDASGLRRYVGGHPMAGSERSGPLAASAALFDGRPWAVTPHETSAPRAVGTVEALARACGATPLRFTPGEHDRAVARTSHVPHLLAVLVAGRLADAPPDHLALSGQGVRDVTRIAAGDPQLWEQIVTANAAAVTTLLRQVRDDLSGLLGALDRPAASPAAAAGAAEAAPEPVPDDVVQRLLRRGVEGAAAIPGKHGRPSAPQAVVYVAVPDVPGELARLFADVGQIGVNVEDVRIDHDLGREVGMLELSVVAEHAGQLLDALTARGWSGHG